MSAKLETLENRLRETLGERLARLVAALGEITIETRVADYLETMRLLRDTPELGFDLLVDLCGVDYSAYGGNWTGRRYAAVTHLLSVAHNWRLRVRVFAEADDFPVLPSIVPVWNSANWFEREAFDLFGILFEGHEDLRRILTDYNFVGHPFRKDFPLAGHVEMHYDPELGRVAYRPVSIAPRELAPTVRREAGYGDGGN
ncbi:MAG: NADH-quinone oxidoreductase subunit C [Zoogloeaceae bacterium]|jgi:NADH-quinone oxidoreductase subunit C|nr:NADH-quinone oxidoreductase subunit C [Zoogloeaceae bacterium]